MFSGIHDFFTLIPFCTTYFLLTAAKSKYQSSEIPKNPDKCMPWFDDQISILD